jgi:hypothetical protein
MIYTYNVCVDGHHFATDSKSAVAYLFQIAKSTMTVEQWNDSAGRHEPVNQATFSKWK